MGKQITIPISDITKELLLDIGIENNEEAEKFLYPKLENLYDYNKIDNIDKAVKIFINNLKQGNEILYWTDYDADGVNSAAILYLGLKDIMKAKKVKGRIKLPTREEGYGMNLSVLKRFVKTNKPSLVVTCDNGIKCLEEIQYCKENGIQVIVLDHHTPDMNNLPNADCLIDLYMDNIKYPFKHLCGAGLAFKFVLAVNNYFKKDLKPLYNLLQYVAIATIADSVPLLDENRLMVQLGLKMMNFRPVIGIEYLLQELNHDGDITEETINYKIAPCLNATGRMTVATPSLKILIAQEKNSQNELLAKNIIDLNNKRKEETQIFVKKGIAYIEKNCSEDYVYVVKLNGCREGLIGLVAGQIKEKYNKPVIVFGEHNGDYVGSARSIPKFNINEILFSLSKYLIKFGGHQLAAGLSIKESNIEIFRKEINKIAHKILKKEDFLKKYKTYHKVLEIKEIPQYYKAIKILAPFGNANTEPLFNINFQTEPNKITKKHYTLLKEKYLKIFGTDYVNAISFNEELAKKYVDNGAPSRLNIIGYLTTNTFNGFTNNQVNILSFE